MSVIIKYKERIKLNNSLLLLLFLGIMYRVSLDIYYLTTISPLFNSDGLLRNPDGLKYIISWIVYIFVYLMMPKGENLLTTFFLNLQFMITYAPMTVYYSLNDQSTLYMFMVTFVLIIQIIILNQPQKKTNLNINLFNMDKYTTVFMIFLIPAILIITILYGGFHGVKAFDLQYLYQIRQNASYPLVLAYILCWVTSAIIPFYIALCLVGRKYVITVALVILEIVFYMILGQKSIYLSLLVLLLVFVFSKTNHLIKVMYGGFTTLSIIATVLYFIEKIGESTYFSTIISSFVGGRFLFIPAANKFLYYEFFSQYPKSYFSDGLIGKTMGLSYQYNGTIGQTIFAYMLGGNLYDSNSNTGYLGDSYAQFGFLGLIVMSILLAYIIRFIDNASRGLGFSFIVSVISIFIVILNDGALLTTLLTNGLFITIILLLIYNKHQGKVLYRRKIK